MKMQLGKRGQLGMSAGDKIIDNVVSLVVVTTIIAGTATLVLDAFANLSNSGLTFGILFATILPLLYAVGVFKKVKKLV